MSNAGGISNETVVAGESLTLRGSVLCVFLTQAWNACSTLLPLALITDH